jgi:2-polyprenyl-6-methoxyphenol hydroxylase-like FAD-dependent oxidoreductase
MEVLQTPSFFPQDNSEDSKKRVEVSADLIVGADGLSSAVRTQMLNHATQGSNSTRAAASKIEHVSLQVVHLDHCPRSQAPPAPSSQFPLGSRAGIAKVAKPGKRLKFELA